MTRNSCVASLRRARFRTIETSQTQTRGDYSPSRPDEPLSFEACIAIGHRSVIAAGYRSHLDLRLSALVLVG